MEGGTAQVCRQRFCVVSILPETRVQVKDPCLSQGTRPWQSHRGGEGAGLGVLEGLLQSGRGRLTLSAAAPRMTSDYMAQEGSEGRWAAFCLETKALQSRGLEQRGRASGRGWKWRRCCG